jgi:CDP-glycerol glycerophosphotransferase (TagB/SpsB family)
MNPIKKIIKGVMIRIPMRDIIIFESNPDYSCNTYPVFQELRKRLPNYKMVWLTTEEGNIPKGVDFAFTFGHGGWKSLMRWNWYKSCAKALISCNRYRNMGSIREGQTSLFLAHGCKTKKTKKHNYCPGSVVDYINIQSPFFDDITCSEYETSKDKLVYLGYPRCDWFYVRNNISDQLSSIGVTGDYLIWLPTFRKQKGESSRDVHSIKYENLGMPLIYNEEMLEECNEFLKGKNLHIIFKPHPVQDVSTLQKHSLSNIHLISDKTLCDFNLQLYQVIAKSKALISDYSSVYFDYLLLDRPIATTVDDKEQWKEGEGFAYDVESIFKKTTEQIANLDELYAFIQNVIIDGNDEKQKARQEMCKQTIINRDGNSAKRVADFVMEKIGEK